MSPLEAVLVFLGAVGLTLWVARRARRRRLATPAPTPAAVPPPDSPTLELYALAAGLADYWSMSAHPRDLVRHEAFVRGVELLAGGDYSTGELLDYSTGGNAVIACMAMEALARRTDGAVPVERVLSTLDRLPWWTRYFALRALDARVDDPLVAPVLARAGEGWTDLLPAAILRDFVGSRLARGERPVFGDTLARVPRERLDALASVLAALDEPALTGLGHELARWRASIVDHADLSGFGRVWGADEGADDDLAFEVAFDVLADLEAQVRATPPHPVVAARAPANGVSTTARALRNVKRPDARPAGGSEGRGRGASSCSPDSR